MADLTTSLTVDRSSTTATTGVPSIPGVSGLIDQNVTTGDLGTIVAILVAFALGIAKYAPKLGLERTKDAAESKLYENLSQRIEKLTQDFEVVKSDRDSLFLQNAELRTRVHDLEAIEQENTRLRERLEARDRQNEKLLNELLQKNEDFDKLKERFHALEIRLTRTQQEVCAECDRLHELSHRVDSITGA